MQGCTHIGSQLAKSNRSLNCFQNSIQFLLNFITTGNNWRRKPIAGKAPSPKWETANPLMWITHAPSTTMGKVEFSCWKTIFYSVSPIPPPWSKVLLGNGLLSQWRGTYGIKEKSRKCTATNEEAQTFWNFVLISMLIIPCLARVLVPEYSKWSDVVLHIPSSMTHQGRQWRLKPSSQTPAGLKRLLSDGDTKESSETASERQGHARFFFKTF